LLVDYASDNNDAKADHAHENHLVCFSLSDTLFPNMKLNARLLFESPGAHGIDIVDDPFENALGSESWHRCHGIPN